MIFSDVLGRKTKQFLLACRIHLHANNTETLVGFFSSFLLLHVHEVQVGKTNPISFEICFEEKKAMEGNYCGYQNDFVTCIMDLNMTFCEQYYALYVRCADNQERILAVLLFF